jgi:hypothetical protein
MKKMDFTKPGKMPGGQDRLAYMQTATNEVLDAIVRMGGNGAVPFVISGAVITRTLVSGTTYNYTITDGCICYNGEILPVSASALAGVNEATNSCYLTVVRTADPLTYMDGTVQNVVLDARIALGAYANGTADDAVKFLWSHLLPAGVAIARANRNALNDKWVAPTLAGTYVPDGSSPIMMCLPEGSKRMKVRGVTDNTVPSSPATNNKIFNCGQTLPYELLLPALSNGTLAVVRVKVNGDVCLAGDVVPSSNVGLWVNVEFDVV